MNIPSEDNIDLRVDKAIRIHETAGEPLFPGIPLCSSTALPPAIKPDWSESQTLSVINQRDVGEGPSKQ